MLNDNSTVFWLVATLVRHGLPLLIGAGTGLACGLALQGVSFRRGLAVGCIAGVGASVLSVAPDFYGSVDIILMGATVALVILVCRRSQP